MVVKFDEDELIEHWTLVGDELGQVAGKRGATRLGFALLLKFYAGHGRFPARPRRVAGQGGGLCRPPSGRSGL
jgi:hypothetical protein